MLLETYLIKSIPNINDKVYIYGNPELDRKPTNTVANGIAATITDIEFDDAGLMIGCWVNLCWHDGNKCYLIKRPLDHLSSKFLGCEHHEFHE